MINQKNEKSEKQRNADNYQGLPLELTLTGPADFGHLLADILDKIGHFLQHTHPVVIIDKAFRRCRVRSFRP
jgi:hypothetical protein